MPTISIMHLLFRSICHETQISGQFGMQQMSRRTNTLPWTSTRLPIRAVRHHIQYSRASLLQNGLNGTTSAMGLSINLVRFDGTIVTTLYTCRFYVTRLHWKWADGSRAERGRNKLNGVHIRVELFHFELGLQRR